MKTIQQINQTLKAFESKFGYKIYGADQKSEVWFNTKLGVLSASNASAIVAKKESATRFTYMAELIAQVCTGIYPEVNAKAMDWGNQHEDACRAYYEFSTGHKLTKLSFVFKDENFREGCSPDALVTDKKGCEIKCPFSTANYIKFLLGDSISSDWKWQAQFTIRCLESEAWDFAEYDPRMRKKPMKIVPIEKNEPMQKTLDDAVPQFIHDMDVALKQIGIDFGDQWERLREKPTFQEGPTI